MDLVLDASLIELEFVVVVSWT